MKILILEKCIELSEFNRKRIRKQFSDIDTFFSDDAELTLYITVSEDLIELELHNGYLEDEEEIYFSSTHYENIYFDNNSVRDPVQRAYVELIDCFDQDIEEIRKIKFKKIIDMINSNREDLTLDTVKVIGDFAINASKVNSSLLVHKMAQKTMIDLRNINSKFDSDIVETKEENDREKGAYKLLDEYNKFVDVCAKNYQNDTIKPISSLAELIYNKSLHQIFCGEICYKSELSNFVEDRLEDLKMLTDDINKTLNVEIIR